MGPKNLACAFLEAETCMIAKERADSFMGTDLTLDDSQGFSGRILDYTWNYLGRKGGQAAHPPLAGNVREHLIPGFRIQRPLNHEL